MGRRAREGRAQEAGPEPQGLQGDGYRHRHSWQEAAPGLKRAPHGMPATSPWQRCPGSEGLLQGRGVGTPAWVGQGTQKGTAGRPGPRQHPQRACSVQSPEQRGSVYQGEKTGSPRLYPPPPPASLPKTWVWGAWGRESGHCPPAFPGLVVAGAEQPQASGVALGKTGAGQEPSQKLAQPKPSWAWEGPWGIPPCTLHPRPAC